MLPKKKKHHVEHQDPFRFPHLQEPIENEVLALFKVATKNMLMGVSKLLVAKVNEGKIEKGRKANIGEIRVWSGKRMQKQPDGGWEPVNEYKEKLDDFLYDLKHNYVLGFDQKDIGVFKQFYRGYPEAMRESACMAFVIRETANNLPERIVNTLSKIRVNLVPQSKFQQEADGFWVGAYDELTNEVYINSEVYNDYGQDYQGQVEMAKTILHEYGHKLHRSGIVDTEILVELWMGKERVSEQATLDIDENFCESFAAYLMALNDVGDIEDNRDMRDFEEEFPLTYKFMKDLFTQWEEENE